MRSATEMFSIAAEIDSKLLHDDERFCGSVKIEHCEGTFLFFDGAFAIKDDVWWLIFTEHHGYHVHHEDEVTVSQYERI